MQLGSEGGNKYTELQVFATHAVHKKIEAEVSNLQPVFVIILITGAADLFGGHTRGNAILAPYMLDFQIWSPLVQIFLNYHPIGNLYTVHCNIQLSCVLI